MLSHEHRTDFCQICKQEQTSIYAEPVRDFKVFVCENCLEAAKYNFVFICLSCGEVFIREKNLFLEKINIPQLFEAYMDCKDLQIIQGLDKCIKCDTERLSKYLYNKKIAGNC